MKKLNLSIPQLLIEFISVVFAVLLALGLNSYKQSRDVREDALSLHAAILSEFKENLNKIDSVLIKNREYEEFLDSLVHLEDDKIKSFYFSYSFQMLTSSAWSITQNSDAANQMDQEFLLKAADIYQTQEFFHEYSTQFFQNVGVMIANLGENTEPRMVRSLYYNVNVMNTSAKGLKKDYEEFLEDYDKK